MAKTFLETLGIGASPLPDELIRRLRSGQAWLIRHEADLRGSQSQFGRFLDVLDTWDRMDEELRGMGFEGCPIGPGGCPAETPVKCRHCGDAEGLGQEAPKNPPAVEGAPAQQRLFPVGTTKH